MDFYNILLNAHKGFGYLEILLVTLFVIALLATMFGFSGKVNKFLKKNNAFHDDFLPRSVLLGIIMLITTFSKGLNMGEVMKNAALRFQYVEHPFSMLIAAVLMTIVNKKVKSNDTISFRSSNYGIDCSRFICICIPLDKSLRGLKQTKNYMRYNL